MKTMTCNQLGGACETAFSGETFDQIAELSKQHAMEMIQAADAAHLEAMARMKVTMQEPGAMQKWFDARKQEFAEMPEDQA